METESLDSTSYFISGENRVTEAFLQFGLPKSSQKLFEREPGSLLERKRKRRREKRALHLLICFPSACPSQTLGQSEARSLELHPGLLCKWQGPEHVGHPPMTFPSTIAGIWVRRGAAVTQTSIHVSCRLCRQWLNPPCHNASSLRQLHEVAFSVSSVAGEFPKCQAVNQLESPLMGENQSLGHFGSFWKVGSAYLEAFPLLSILWSFMFPNLSPCYPNHFMSAGSCLS